MQYHIKCEQTIALYYSAANFRYGDQDPCYTARDIKLLYSLTKLQFNQDYYTGRYIGQCLKSLIFCFFRREIEFPLAHRRLSFKCL